MTLAKILILTSALIGVAFLVVVVPILVVQDQNNTPYGTKYGFAWVRLGRKIEGIQDNSDFGESVSLSVNGNVVAVGANKHNRNTGVTRIFKYSGTAWDRIGNIINGKNQQEFSGNSVSMDQTGSRVCIGAIGTSNTPGAARVYEFLPGTSEWNQVGNDVVGLQDGGRFGMVVSMALDGKSFLASADFYQATLDSKDGYVQVWHEKDGEWAQKGLTIYGSNGAWSGFGADLSGSGKTLCVGDRAFDVPEVGRAGRVHCYQWSSNEWKKKGDDIWGTEAGEGMGYSVAVSDTGGHVVVGARFGGNSKQGAVRAYEYKSGKWRQMGQDLFGSKTDDQAGYKVAVSANGRVLAFSARGDDGSGLNAGAVRMFRYEGGEWVQLGRALEGEVGGDNFGESVSLNNDGTIVASASNWNNTEYVTVSALL